MFESFIMQGRSKSVGMMDQIEQEIADLNEADAARAVIREQGKESGLQLLLHWNHTILQYVIYDFQIYVSLIVYFVTVHYLQTGAILVAKSGGTAIKVITCLTSMMTFLLVFYLNESYRRYNAQYICQIKLSTRINAIAIYICSKSSKGETGKLKAGQIMRYLNAAQVIGYTSVTASYTEDNFCWPMIRKHHLLTENEIQYLSQLAIDHDSTKFVPTRMNSNSSKSAKSAKISASSHQNAGYIQGAAFRKVLMWVTDSFIEMIASKDFEERDRSYVMRYLTILNDVMNELFAVATTTVDQNGAKIVSYNTDVFYGMFIVIFSNVFINGLYILSRMLQDPFGKDSVDLSVHDYVELCINSCNAMVKDMGTAPPFDKDIELQLKYRRSDPLPVVS